MASIYTRPEPVQRTPYWGGSTVQPFRLQAWPYRTRDFPRGTTSTSSFVQAPGIGAVPAGAPGILGYALASLLGSALGGALLGYVAAGDREGARRGAALAAGVSALSDGWYFGAAREVAPAVGFGIAGALGVGYAVRRMQRKRRR